MIDVTVHVGPPFVGLSTDTVSVDSPKDLCNLWLELS